ncbi:secretin N-terminal domain-containing protein [Uliginosibacterium flavum]|uniref:Secretin N-terminal domain-containing protein n=1 Tax=Uliginosibacterium flavum TaxID=1396831 RepID=A0ABV2TFZ2_9RHOO
MRNLLFALVLILLAPLVQAQQRMEIIPLRYRLIEQVMPTLRPLLEPGGSMSAMSGKIIVRASPENIEQIRRALEAIDTRARSLMISVRQGGSAQEEDTRIGADGRVVIRNGDIDVSGRGQAYSRNSQSSGQTLQTIQTVEDGEAYIYLGKSVPLPMTQMVYGPGGAVVSRGTQYVDVGSGFSVRPQLAGDQVVLTIAPQNQRMNGSGAIEGSRLSTTVRGRLGQWMPLGGVSQQSDNRGSGIVDYRSGRSEQTSEYWIKVEAME